MRKSMFIKQNIPRSINLYCFKIINSRKKSICPLSKRIPDKYTRFWTCIRFVGERSWATIDAQNSKLSCLNSFLDVFCHLGQTGEFYDSINSGKKCTLPKYSRKGDSEFLSKWWYLCSRLPLVIEWQHSYVDVLPFFFLKNSCKSFGKKLSSIIRWLWNLNVRATSSKWRCLSSTTLFCCRVPTQLRRWIPPFFYFLFFFSGEYL